MKTFTLEQVFNEAAYPEVTFVPPSNFAHIRSSFKTKGKHVTISGASGTGKTTLVTHALRELGISPKDILWINGRQFAGVDAGLSVLARALRSSEDFDEITDLLKLVYFTVIDDFHHLSTGAKLEIAKLLKLWHEKDVRFVVIGIASSAADLYGADPELGIRNDPFEMREQDEGFVRTLIRLGEEALNVKFGDSLCGQIIAASNCVPSVIQVICKTCCIEAEVDETVEGDPKDIHYDLKDLRESVLRVFHAKYMNKVVGLAQGKRRARAVHNTYFDIVTCIARDRRSEIPTASLYQDVVGVVPEREERKRKATSFYNCLNNLEEVISEQGLDDTIHFVKGKAISIEDPTFRFYMNLVDIEEIRKRITIRNSQYPYDVAVSFAGEIRPTVEEFVRALEDRGLSVFYDFDQQALLWGQDLRVLLAQVYSSEALYMVVFLSETYPERDWTEFEVSIGKSAAKKRTQEYLLPLLVDDVKVVGIADTVGHVDLRKVEIERAADILAEKVQLATEAPKPEPALTPAPVAVAAVAAE
ncbi:TIR domain-containing protein [Geomonas sp. RF6]|uniref:TIR domain-containing protein n=1 Tax=Geomonas sp. RF6 TaxID=2897342 RepID=UPI001E4CB212|nr:TIR domain-containing protein [Geomonas sp. RF6]UFS72268.1 TIR domain-containing protein [Geomonas sp. RF6]